MQLDIIGQFHKRQPEGREGIGWMGFIVQVNVGAEGFPEPIWDAVRAGSSVVHGPDEGWGFVYGKRTSRDSMGGGNVSISGRHLIQKGGLGQRSDEGGGLRSMQGEEVQAGNLNHLAKDWGCSMSSRAA